MLFTSCKPCLAKKGLIHPAFSWQGMDKLSEYLDNTAALALFRFLLCLVSESVLAALPVTSLLERNLRAASRSTVTPSSSAPAGNSYMKPHIKTSHMSHHYTQQKTGQTSRVWPQVHAAVPVTANLCCVNTDWSPTMAAGAVLLCAVLNSPLARARTAAIVHRSLSQFTGI